MAKRKKRKGRYRIDLMIIMSILILILSFCAYMGNTSLEDVLDSKYPNGIVLHKDSKDKTSDSSSAQTQQTTETTADTQHTLQQTEQTTQPVQQGEQSQQTQQAQVQQGEQVTTAAMQ